MPEGRGHRKASDGPVQTQVVLVDEDEFVLRELTHLLSLETDLRVVSSCRHGRDAAHIICRLKPQLVFLEVHPCGGGFDALKALPLEDMPVTVFISPCDIYCVQALALHKLPFLLKPFLYGRLDNVLGHARALLEQRSADRTAWARQYSTRIQATQMMLQEFQIFERSPAQTSYLARIPVKVGARIRFVPTKEINYIESNGDYVTLHTNGSKHLVRARISDLERRLNPQRFARIHRSVVVQVDRINEICGAFHGDYLVVLCDKTELTLSRHYKENLFRLFGHPL